MEFFYDILAKSKDPEQSLTITNALGSDLEPATSTSTIVSSTVDPMPSGIPSSVATANFQATDVTTASGVSDLDDLAPVVYARNKSPSPNAIMQANVASTESEQNLPYSGPFFFPGQNIIIKDGIFNIFNTGPYVTGAGLVVPIHHIPNSSPIFTGQRDILDKLGKIFVHRVGSKLSWRRSCLLWGMGGIGKTQICLKFIEEMSDSFPQVFWVDASSEESITLSLKGISATSFALASGVDGSVGSVLQWISCIQEEWLIVFDDANDAPEVVARFIPAGNRGNILITSRNRSMGRVISFENSIEIGEMEEHDATALLLKASCLDPVAEHLQVAKEIVSELGCIPLAIDQAGAYIEAGKCDINQYLGQLFSHRQLLLSDDTFRGASKYDKTVYGTWDLSFKEIERRAGESISGGAQAAKAAILILQICAYYHHSNISKEIFQSAAEQSREQVADNNLAKILGRQTKKLPMAINALDYTLLALKNDGHWDDFIFTQGVSVLLSFSLIKRGQSVKILSIHPLVHSWSRDRMSKYEQQRICQMGGIILSCAITWRFTYEDYTLRQLIFPHIKANELHGSQIGLIKQYYDDKYSNFALVMDENEDWDNAEQLEIQIMDMRKKFLGAEHPDTLKSMGNLASRYCHQERWNEAEQLGVKVMGLSKKLLGAEHPSTLTSMVNLGVIYWNQRRWSEAEQLQVQVINMSKELLGAEHPETLRIMANLAIAYGNQKKWAEAELLSVQVIENSRKLFGVEHPNTLTSMEDLAGIYWNQERWNHAETLEVQVMYMRKKLLGAEHPSTLTSMKNLARVYHSQGRHNEGEQLELEIKIIKERRGRG